MLGTVDINRGIFQGDSLSPLLFIMIMAPLSMILKDEQKGYKLGNSGNLVNHLLFMDDLKLYGKSQDEIDALLGLVQEYSNDIGMVFGMDKCAVLGIKKGKRVECSGVELPSGDMMNEVDEEGYKYLGVLQDAIAKNREMKEKVGKEYLRRVKLLSKSKLYAGNLVNGINAWAVGVIRYSAGILDWTCHELKKLDTKTRKILTMAGAFNRKGSTVRLYRKRSEGGKGLIGIEDCVRLEEANLAQYVSNSEEWLLKEVSEMALVSSVETGEELKKRRDVERKESLLGKPLHGKFFATVEKLADEGDVDLDRSWQWLKGGFLTKASEGYIMAAQEQALQTRWRKSTIEGVEDENGLCRICGKWFETVKHVVSGCSELAKKQYRIRHDKVGSRIHWELCRKFGIECASKWYDHVPSRVSKTKDGLYELFWDRKIVGCGVEFNKPDLVIVDQVNKKWTIVDFCIPWDGNVKAREDEKKEKYSPLAEKIRSIYKVKTETIPIVIGALGTVPKRLPGFLHDLGVPDVIGCMQTCALLGSQRILKNTLSI